MLGSDLIDSGRQRPRMLTALLCLAALPTTAMAQSVHNDLLDWGLEVYGDIDETLRVDGTRLFAQSAALNGAQFGGHNSRAYVWPASTQFRVFTALAQLEPVVYQPILRQFSDELHAAYWNNGYRSGAGGGDRFYDDNAHIVVALVEAYRLTDDPVYLQRAVNTQAFVMQGEDAAAGGGIYFKQFDGHSKDAISTLQGARGAAMLYRETGASAYLQDALRLLGWANSNIQLGNGLYNQRLVVATGEPEGVNLVNSAGMAISLNLELYDATGAASYFTEARRIANASLGRYFDAATGRLNPEGYWAYELIDALNNLYLHDETTTWRNAAIGAMSWLHENKRDENGRYDEFWGRNGPVNGMFGEWSLNEQASVARAFLSTATTILPGDVNQDGVITSDDIEGFVDGWLSDTTALNYVEKLRAGDLNLDGKTDARDFILFREAMNKAGIALPAAVAARLNAAAPEPTGVVIALVALTLDGVVRSHRRRPFVVSQHGLTSFGRPH